MVCRATTVGSVDPVTSGRTRARVRREVIRAHWREMEP